MHALSLFVTIWSVLASETAEPPRIFFARAKVVNVERIELEPGHAFLVVDLDIVGPGTVREPPVHTKIVAFDKTACTRLRILHAATTGDLEKIEAMRGQTVDGVPVLAGACSSADARVLSIHVALLSEPPPPFTAGVPMKAYRPHDWQEIAKRRKDDLLPALERVLAIGGFESVVEIALEEIATVQALSFAVDHDLSTVWRHEWRRRPWLGIDGAYDVLLRGFREDALAARKTFRRSHYLPLLWAISPERTLGAVRELLPGNESYIFISASSIRDPRMIDFFIESWDATPQKMKARLLNELLGGGRSTPHMDEHSLEFLRAHRVDFPPEIAKNYDQAQANIYARRQQRVYDPDVLADLIDQREKDRSSTMYDDVIDARMQFTGELESDTRMNVALTNGKTLVVKLMRDFEDIARGPKRGERGTVEGVLGDVEYYGSDKQPKIRLDYARVKTAIADVTPPPPRKSKSCMAGGPLGVAAFALLAIARRSRRKP